MHIPVDNLIKYTIIDIWLKEECSGGGLTEAQRNWGEQYIQPWVERESVEELGERMYQAIVKREETGINFAITTEQVPNSHFKLPSFRFSLKMPPLPSLELSQLRRVVQAAGFAAATVLLGYSTGNSWIERFSELPQAHEIMIHNGAQLRSFEKTYLSSDDPELRNIILQEAQPIAIAINQARRIDRKWEELDGLLLVSSAATLLAGVVAFRSIPIRRSRVP